MLALLTNLSLEGSVIWMPVPLCIGILWVKVKLNVLVTSDGVRLNLVEESTGFKPEQHDCDFNFSLTISSDPMI